MTVASKTTIKTYFTTGATPSQQNFTDLIDSFLGIGESGSQTIPSPIIVSGTTNLVGNVTVSGNTAMYGTATLGAAAQTSWQTALGLGTAALLDVGTGASKVVQMTAAAKLPAVDGSLLTNISTGAWILLSTQPATNSATIDFTSLITSTYKNYLVLINDVVAATNDASLWMRMSQDNGATFLASSSYNWGSLNQRTNSATITGLQANAANQIVLGASNGNAAADTTAGSVRIFSPLSTVAPTRVLFDLITDDTATGNILWQYGAASSYTSIYTINALRFMMSSGNITSGTFKLYGIS